MREISDLPDSHTSGHLLDMSTQGRQDGEYTHNNLTSVQLLVC